MAKQFARFEGNHKSFIARQRIFFTASGLLDEEEMVS